MGNEDYVSLSDRLAQSQADRASNMALGNWSVGTATSTGGSGGLWIDASMRRAMDSMMYGSSVTYASSFGGSGKSEAQKTKVALKVLDKIKASAHTFTAKEQTELSTEAGRYRKLGLEKIAEKLETKAMKAWKELEISLAGYKRINASELEKFRQELRNVGDSTSKRDLIETPLSHYIGQGIDEGQRVDEKTEMGVPPTEVLEKLEVAQNSKLFDAFSVLHIKYVPDPILCGRINESNDLYFIAEWGDDVKLADIVKE